MLYFSIDIRRETRILLKSTKVARPSFNALVFAKVIMRNEAEELSTKSFNFEICFSIRGEFVSADWCSMFDVLGWHVKNASFAKVTNWLHVFGWDRWRQILSISSSEVPVSQWKNEIRFVVTCYYPELTNLPQLWAS